MTTYIVRASNEAAALAAFEQVGLTLVGKGADMVMLPPIAEQISAPVMGQDKDGLPVVRTPGVYGPVQYSFEVTLHDGVAAPEWPEGVTVEEGVCSFSKPVAAPTPVVAQPQVLSVTMAQARVALRHAGLLDQIDAGLKSLPDGTREDALLAWEYAPTVSRTGALVNSLASLFGLTNEQLDALFAKAATIEL